MSQASAQPATVFSSLLGLGCQKNKPGGFVWRNHAEKPVITKVSPGCYHSIGATASPQQVCVWGAPRSSPVPVHVCSDRSGGPAVPEDSGDPLPGCFLRRAPGVRCHRLRHPSLALAAAHCHSAHLLPPALLLVSALPWYLCPQPKKTGFCCLILRETGHSLLAPTPCGANRRSPEKKEREIGPFRN